MARYKLTDDARTDLREIKDYSREKYGITMTAEYLKGMQNTLQRLAENPGIGCDETTDLMPDVYSFPCLSQRIYYLITPEGITIIGIVHQSRLPNHLRKRAETFTAQ